MLVDNKFIFIEIPRCASTSFVQTCIINDIKIESIKSHGYENLIKSGVRFHANINELQKKFGYNYPIIAIRRNKVESFVSLWKHTIKMIDGFEFPEVANAMSKMTWEEIFYFEKNDYDFFNEVDVKTIVENLVKKIHPDANKISPLLFKQLFWPKEWFHRNNPNVIWFDFNNLSKLEDWVSNTLNKDFKLLKINESNEVKCNIVVDDLFIKKYNELYSKYENIKTQKSLL